MVRAASKMRRRTLRTWRRQQGQPRRTRQRQQMAQYPCGPPSAARPGSRRCSWPRGRHRGGCCSAARSPDTARAGAVLNGPVATHAAAALLSMSGRFLHGLFEGALDASPAVPFCASWLAGGPPSGRTPRREGRCRVLRRPAETALDAALRDIDVSAMTCLGTRPPPSTKTNTAIVGFLSWARLPSR